MLRAIMAMLVGFGWRSFCQVPSKQTTKRFKTATHARTRRTYQSRHGPPTCSPVFVKENRCEKGSAFGAVRRPKHLYRESAIFTAAPCKEAPSGRNA
jgi:hypothetical protein